MTRYISRLVLNRNPGKAAFELLESRKERGRRDNADHQIVWHGMHDHSNPQGDRDFLFRTEPRARGYMVLSHRPPMPKNPLFEAIETKEFDPPFKNAALLRFQMRANVIRREKREPRDPDKPGGRKKVVKIDAVYDVLRQYPERERAANRMRVAQEVGAKWLQFQGERHGFTPQEVMVEDYRSVTFAPTEKKAKPPTFGIVEMSGVLRVDDRATFLEQMFRGYGSAKAYGNGLMLVRPA